jgi:hypothetical protein
MRSTLLTAAALAALLLPGVASAQLLAPNEDAGSQFAKDMAEYYDNKTQAEHRGFEDGMFGQSPYYGRMTVPSEFQHDYNQGYGDGAKLHVR